MFFINCKCLKTVPYRTLCNCGHDRAMHQFVYQLARDVCQIYFCYIQEYFCIVNLLTQFLVNFRFHRHFGVQAYGAFLSYNQGWLRHVKTLYTNFIDYTAKLTKHPDSTLAWIWLNWRFKRESSYFYWAFHLQLKSLAFSYWHMHACMHKRIARQ